MISSVVFMNCFVPMKVKCIATVWKMGNAASYSRSFLYAATYTLRIRLLLVPWVFLEKPVSAIYMRLHWEPRFPRNRLEPWLKTVIMK